ncbi:dienelactone hydrolase family protein [Marinitenerispora sediminis]|uniref:Dienelactone hydrolase n=1 Tax=Marinitenerispora sediminis TaxID=1931232 RepID=A0A368SZK3_9ACTN|nr:dienelactone hydrolase family protein [Marinitenerispora sediminis]RCV48020.1 dienelactone hydrolase [Marinitenerispora sediminis]RCV48026.1 dienelactone hydrolase [Marinitenerispora sediminis]RCV51022.1 dienelactone hydrolase [Marinitenerispora sediminis]
MASIERDRITVGDLTAHVARPVGAPPGAGMLLLPMVTGIGRQMRAYADEVAAVGVTSVVWDPWHGHSDEDLPLRELMERMGGLVDAEVRAEQRRLLDHMFGRMGLSRVGVMGWCMGGRFALLLAAHDHRVANCVAYHPSVFAEPAPNQTEDAVALAERIAAPVGVVYPGADHLVPREVIEALSASLLRRGAASTLLSVHPGAEHGFMDASRQEREPNRVARRDSWPAMLALVRATLEVGAPVPAPR